MKEHIDGEDKRKPLTDEELASILKEKDISSHAVRQPNTANNWVFRFASQKRNINLKRYEVIFQISYPACSIRC